MILQFEHISSLLVSDACDIIRQAPKKRLGDLRVYDLILNGPNEISGLQGVYFFFDPDSTTCLYVGKNSSAQYVERIPWHFAVREESWQNHFLKYYRTHIKAASLAAAAHAAVDCQLLLLPLPNKAIAKAERLSRAFQQPKFNGFASGQRIRESVPCAASLEQAILNHI